MGAIGGLVGLGGDILGGLTKLIGKAVGAAGDTKTADTIDKVGGGIQGVCNCASGCCGAMAGTKF